MTQVFNVVVVGAGLLGRRHLQSLELCNADIRVFVVDTSVLSLERAQEDLNDTNFFQSAKYYKSIEEVDANIDVAIVATTANGRLSVLEALFAKGVSNVILEKVAFNSLYDIEKAENLVKQKGAGVWVNCPRRLYSFYKELRSVLKGYKVTNYSIQGSNYGLACNGIHYIDFFSYLEECSNYSFEHVNVASIVESKRDGYVEYFGDLVGVFSSGCSFQLSCADSESLPQYKIIIELEEGCVEIDEINGSMKIDINEKVEKWSFRMPYQSELTGPLVDAVLAASECELTGFYESMRIHTPFVRMAYDEYAGAYGSNKKMFVPIT